MGGVWSEVSDGTGTLKIVERGGIDIASRDRYSSAPSGQCERTHPCSADADVSSLVADTWMIASVTRVVPVAISPAPAADCSACSAIISADVTIRAARRAMAKAFVEAGIDTPDLDSRLLMAAAVGLDGGAPGAQPVVHPVLGRDAAGEDGGPRGRADG